MKRKLLSTMMLCAIIFSANAQTDSFTRYSVGINAGTFGGGIWGATNIADNFVLRVGFSHFGLTFPTDLEESFAAYNRQTLQQLPNEVDVNFGRPRWRMPHGKVIAGWYPNPNGIFSLQLGTYIGAFDFVVSGQVDHPTPEDIFFEFVNVRLEPRADGTFDGRLRMGNIIKPYFGIGLGRIIPNSNIGFQFDLGVAYQGRLRFISDQATIGNVNEEIHSEHIPEGLEIISTIADIFRFWPVMNFSLSYRF